MASYHTKNRKSCPVCRADTVDRVLHGRPTINPMIREKSLSVPQKKLGYVVFGLHIEQFNGSANHFTIDAMIDLREVRRLEADGNVERLKLELETISRFRVHRIG